MKVLFTGGGTAGHINPALAVAGYLLQKEPQTEILYVGNRGGMEERLVKKAGYQMAFITISGFQRKLTPKNLVRNFQTLGRIFSATAETKKIIQDFEDQKFHVLWYQLRGPRELTSNVPINTPADMTGRKMKSEAKRS